MSSSKPRKRPFRSSRNPTLDDHLDAVSDLSDASGLLADEAIGAGVTLTTLFGDSAPSHSRGTASHSSTDELEPKRPRIGSSEDAHDPHGSQELRIRLSTMADATLSVALASTSGIKAPRFYDSTLLPKKRKENDEPLSPAAPASLGHLHPASREGGAAEHGPKLRAIKPSPVTTTSGYGNQLDLLRASIPETATVPVPAATMSDEQRQELSQQLVAHLQLLTQVICCALVEDTGAMGATASQSAYRMMNELLLRFRIATDLRTRQLQLNPSGNRAPVPQPAVVTMPPPSLPKPLPASSSGPQKPSSSSPSFLLPAAQLPSDGLSPKNRIYPSVSPLPPPSGKLTIPKQLDPGSLRSILPAPSADPSLHAKSPTPPMLLPLPVQLSGDRYSRFVSIPSLCYGSNTVWAFIDEV
ncbi:MAG: hypothetical protein Q8P67_26365, partial [archaeon]|nr:hypothetical protein [archaeon]